MKSPKEIQKPYGLCFRCENRARFLESSRQGDPDRPRFQCGDPTYSAHSCYMFQPVKPVVTWPNDPKDKRPRFAPAIISSREAAAVIPKCRLKIKRYGKKGAVLYWEVLEEK